MSNNKGRICLHGLDVKHQAQLLGLVKKALPAHTVKHKVKEKYFSDNDMYKYRLARFMPKADNGARVCCAWGVLLVSDKPVAAADIIIEFDRRRAEAAAEVERLLAKLLSGKLQFVVEEPDFSQRLDQLRGCYALDKQDDYDTDNAASALVCHLPWQVYGVSKLWAQVLASGGERPLWRQLRVKLRRLRSSLTFFKPLLPPEAAQQWQQLLKERAARLSAVREYDVLLLACSRLGQNQEQEAAPQLTACLRSLRQEELGKALDGVRLNELTLELARFLLWLHTAPAEEGRALETFLRRRFAVWVDKLLRLPEKYPDLRDMEQLHCIRIKLKRFRYALQTVPELAASPRLLRNVKYLQDMLGFLHDAYVNGARLNALAAAHPELRCEAALLRGWDRGKADAALERLPRQWEEFTELLRDWAKENL
ncbi:MAG: CHAD domain-containing protein [Phascolarctobacterium sp.]|uniref:CHAD domain-containing protein n=1 Tax=Phascolarctobacterium sp. TaxID=2049039 RepID=UPI0026DC9584|nr:CHAD domain-containing protein [Phascolarctobacterium sp.]MDO4921452.1 CHAD domain-containing protein [Phascolarctobacterium sp.]